LSLAEKAHNDSS